MGSSQGDLSATLPHTPTCLLLRCAARAPAWGTVRSERCGTRVLSPPSSSCFSFLWNYGRPFSSGVRRNSCQRANPSLKGHLLLAQN